MPPNVGSFTISIVGCSERTVHSISFAVGFVLGGEGCEAEVGEVGGGALRSRAGAWGAAGCGSHVVRYISGCFVGWPLSLFLSGCLLRYTFMGPGLEPGWGE